MKEISLAQRPHILPLIPDHYWTHTQSSWENWPSYRPPFDEIVETLKYEIILMNFMKYQKLHLRRNFSNKI